MKSTTTARRTSFPRQHELEMKDATAEIVPVEVVVKDGESSRKPGLLESVGAVAFALAGKVVERVEKLPYPVGPSVHLVEELVTPKMVSVSRTLESVTLQALAFADEQVERLMEAVDRCVQVFRDTVDVSKHVLRKLVSVTTDRVKGLEPANSLVDYAANLLVNYEIIVKSRTDSALRLVLKLSGVGAAGCSNRGLESVKEKSPVVVQEEIDSLESPSHDAGVHVGVKKSQDKVTVIEEISPVKGEKSSKVVDAFNNGDEEADELSRLIDATWCLGSPRRLM